jgi:hypothetical protein
VAAPGRVKEGIFDFRFLIGDLQSPVISRQVFVLTDN